ncbi:MAG: hypothetical protein DHS20C01_13390 [marine bacterium B5-7]|nr:MAG: hypothetical protein DHS20C01_13390 [marine bacterium B5-7]
MKTDNRSLEGDDDAERVFAEYLREHPDFFQRHASLLSQLIIPHPSSGQAVSLLERQVMVLREQQSTDQKRLRELISNARENDRLNRRMEKLALYLMGIHSLQTLLDDLPRVLRRIFDLEFTYLRRIGEENLNDLSDAVTRHLDEAACLSGLSDTDRQWLFNDDADEVKSSALIPLKFAREQTPFACIALGSTESSRYHPRTGTLFLVQLQRLISASASQLNEFEAK